MQLLEGGNVFKDERGTPLTQRINLADIKLTVKYLESLTGLPLLDNMLGSTGKKPTSGDLDLAVDAKKHTKDEVYNKLIAKGASNQDVAKSGDSVHYKCPINGDPMNGYVQVDFMFGDPKWQQFALNASSLDTPIKNLRNNLINNIDDNFDSLVPLNQIKKNNLWQKDSDGEIVPIYKTTIPTSITQNYIYQEIQGVGTITKSSNFENNGRESSNTKFFEIDSNYALKINDFLIKNFKLNNE